MLSGLTGTLLLGRLSSANLKEEVRWHPGVQSAQPEVLGLIRWGGIGPCEVPSVLGWEASDARSGHPPHLDSWHCLDRLCSATCGHELQTCAFTSGFLEPL